MNSQLQWITDLLNRNDVPYWVDDGTLLGLVRDGELILSDRDIDISMWYADIDDADPIIPIAKKNGYRVIERKYYGEVQSYQVYPRSNDDHPRTINIKFYRKYNNHAWLPTPRRKKRPNSLIQSALWMTGMFYWKAIFGLFDTKPVPTYPVRIQETRLYWIPVQYFHDLNQNEDFSVTMPANPEDYLEYRFGQSWETPTDDWDMWRDDGGVRESLPNGLISNTMYRSE